MTDERIQRINALAKKAKEQGLTDAEKAEQAALRKEYIAAIRGNIKAQLDNIDIIRPDGTTEQLKKKS